MADLEESARERETRKWNGEDGSDNFIGGCKEMGGLVGISEKLNLFDYLVKMI